MVWSPRMGTSTRRPATRCGSSVVALTWLLLASACASLETPRCGSGERAAVSELLYFGTDRPDGGTVSAAEWTAFLNTVVTPRFPAGLTVWSAAGQWQSATGAITRESSYVLNLLHPGDATSETGVRAVVAEYRQRFAQEAVLRVRSAVCMSL